MPGDDLVANPTFVATRAITIRGRPEDIWPWIAQMGFDRAGYYGYDLIENIGSKTGIRSAESIVPEFAASENWRCTSDQYGCASDFRHKSNRTSS